MGGIGVGIRDIVAEKVSDMAYNSSHWTYCADQAGEMPLYDGACGGLIFAGIAGILYTGARLLMRDDE